MVTSLTSTFPLYNAIRSCTECSLRTMCLGPVPGIGPLNAAYMFVGEAPGEHEDEDGQPFTGAAGLMVDDLLGYLGLDRVSVYLSNTVRCRPRNNATPTPIQAQFCADKWLRMEVDLIRPRVIVAMGQAATRYLLQDDTVTVEHSHSIPHWVTFPGHDRPTMIFPTYHPAAGLYTTSQLRMVFDDFRVLKEIVDGADPWAFVPVDLHPDPVYIEVQTTEHALALLSQPVFALDTETVPDQDGVPRLWSVQVSTEPGTAFFIPVGLIPDPMTAIPPASTVIVHNYLYDVQFIGIPKFVDTMVCAYLLGLPQGLKELAYRLCGMEMHSYSEYVREYRQDKALAYLSEAEWRPWPDPEPVTETSWDNDEGRIVSRIRHPQHINRKIWKILDDVLTDPSTDAFRRWNDYDSQERAGVEAELGPMLDASLAEVDRDRAVFYSSRDADATIRIKAELLSMIHDAGLDFILNAIDLPTLPVIREMMDVGMPINPDHYASLSAQFAVRLDSKAADCAAASGYGSFNPNSSPQVADLLYGKLAFPVTKRTDSGLPSTDDRELKKIRDPDNPSQIHPIVEHILEYRRVLKIKTSFSDVIPSVAELDQDGVYRVRCNIRSTRTETGRLSASNPINLQAMPVRYEEGVWIRDGFEAPPGHSFLAPDYSQIEMRLLAHASASPRLIKLFLDGLDIHTQTASLLFGVSYDEAKQSRYRYPTKRMNFGIVYGITALGLHEGLVEEGIESWSLADCEKLLVEYDTAYPEVKQYRQSQINHARRLGYVTDFLGRRRYIPELFCPIRRIKAEGERAAGNMPIQAGAQEIIKLAENKIQQDRDLGLSPVPFKILLQIHDELILEVRTNHLGVLGQWVKPIMENVVKLSVPLEANLKSGTRWGSLKED